MIVALIWCGLAVLLALVMGAAIHLADVLEAREQEHTCCPNPLSHPVGYGRNGEHL